MDPNRFQFAWGARAGEAHRRDGRPCQDKVAHVLENGVAAIALADGAGYSLLSQVGAEQAASACVRLLAEGISPLLELPEEEAAQRLVAAILADYPMEYPLEDLASTLLFAAVEGDRFLAGHIGDGVAVRRINGEAAVLSRPDNGLYANQTFFLTDEGAEKRLRLYKGEFRAGEGFLLMSDGAAASLYSPAGEALSPTCGELFRWLEQHGGAAVSRAIEENMESAMSVRTGDDLSAILLFYPEGGEESKNRTEK